MTTCPGSVEVRAGEDTPLGRIAGQLGHDVIFGPDHRDHPPARATAASCINRPRSATTRSPSAKSMAPAATNAVYSPKLSPAAPDN